MHSARSTNIERFANTAIREEVDQDDRRNDHTSQGRPGVEHAKRNGIFLFLFVVPAALFSSL
jgi:hypothetical protein